jgi:hypothetical protein
MNTKNECPGSRPSSSTRSPAQARTNKEVARYRTQVGVLRVRTASSTMRFTAFRVVDTDDYYRKNSAVTRLRL